MARKATKLQIPQIYLGSTCYAGFLKATFLANGQNKSLMDKEAIDQAWTSGLRSLKRELGEEKVQRLLSQASSPGVCNVHLPITTSAVLYP